jgi:signal transduction histidine kinase
VDLGGPDAAPESGPRLVELGFSAATPVAPESGPGAAWLLAGGDDDAPGAVRPRTLAALAAAAARLAGPVRAAAAGARLAALDTPVRRLDVLASLGEMLTEVLHEVRNPLVSVKTFLQLLPDRADDPEFRSEFVEVVGEEVRRIERLLDAVLHHARAGAREEEELGPVAPVLESVARLLGPRARREGIALEVEAPPDLTLPMDVDALRQVALNLALNALDATPAGGTVRLAAGTEDDGALVLDCDDDGPGVPPAWRERMFEPFATTRGDRAGGLGLAIARRMAEERGGSLEVSDREGGGTRMRLRLPRPASG